MKLWWWHWVNWKATSQKDYNDLFSSSATEARQDVLSCYGAENEAVSRRVSLAMNALAWLHVSTFG